MVFLNNRYIRLLGICQNIFKIRISTKLHIAKNVRQHKIFTLQHCYELTLRHNAQT